MPIGVGGSGGGGSEGLELYTAFARMERAPLVPYENVAVVTLNKYTARTAEKILKHPFRFQTVYSSYCNLLK